MNDRWLTTCRECGAEWHIDVTNRSGEPEHFCPYCGGRTTET